ncbi:unnamed protein product [Gongylonema pulchrum]|uniref:Thioesterase n=1 Tax=Gongylonema pulchrum TaxID=637853 RepID=A0A183E043_9BILA|nr:unnamed protein product [Gongylonema pulchrum]
MKPNEIRRLSNTTVIPHIQYGAYLRQIELPTSVYREQAYINFFILIQLLELKRGETASIYLADYLPQNRKELFRWTIGSSVFDWTQVLKMIATVEGAGWLQLKEMELQARSKVRFEIRTENFSNIERI